MNPRPPFSPTPPDLGGRFHSERSSEKRSVLFVNRSYWPDAEATGQLLTDLCESLTDRFDVSVLCGQPNSNPTSTAFVTSGMQSRNGVTIHRLKHLQFPKRKSLGRMANLLSFTLATRTWLRAHSRFDIVVSETDPFLLPLVVAPHCRSVKATYIAYLQDIYPDIAIRLGVASDGWFTRQLRDRLRRAYRSAGRVIVLSDAMKRELIGWGIEPDAIAIVPNWVDCESVVPLKSDNAFRTRHRWQERFVVMHSGNMGMSQKLCSLIRAVDEPAFPKHGKLVLIGGGADEPRLRKLAELSPRRDDIVFLPYQPRESLAESLSSADIHVVSMDPRIGGTLMPSKLYGILASGTPVLAIADPSTDVARLVLENNVGVISPEHEPSSIAGAIARLAEQQPADRQTMQNNARLLALSHYDRRICVEQFAHHLAEVGPTS